MDAALCSVMKGLRGWDVVPALDGEARSLDEGGSERSTPEPVASHGDAELSGDRVLCRARNVFAHWLGDELIVLSADGKLLRGLNAPAGQVYLRMDGQTSLDELADALAAAAGAEQTLVRGGVLRLASALSRLGLLTAAEGMPSTPERPLGITAWAEPAIMWEQRFVGLQTLSDCRPPSQNGNCP